MPPPLRLLQSVPVTNQAAEEQEIASATTRGEGEAGPNAEADVRQQVGLQAEGAAGDAMNLIMQLDSRQTPFSSKPGGNRPRQLALGIATVPQ